MAPPRTFDYDLLKRLIREHAEWPYAQYAKELTADVRTRDPNAPAVLPESVRRVVWQYRDTWAEEGVQFPDRGVIHTDLLPPAGTVAPNQRMSTPLRYLREISKERKGEAPASDFEQRIRRQALKWAARLQERREIVDIGPNGAVIIRSAEADELDDQGQLIELAAWVLPGKTPARRPVGRGRS